MKCFYTIITFMFLLFPFQANSETIQVLTEEMPPYNYTEDGVIKGISTEVVRLVLNRAGLDYSIKSYPWKRSYKMALSDPNTPIYSIGRNTKREGLFKWVGTISSVNIYLWKMKNRPEIKIKTFEDVRKYKISSVLEDYTTQYLISKKIEGLDMVRSYALIIRKLYRQRTDLMIIDELTLFYLIRKEAKKDNRVKFQDFEKIFFARDISADMYMAFSNNTSNDIVERSRKALSELKSSDEYKAIKDKFY